MTICRFWKAGNCRFGDSCRNEHPPGVGPNTQMQPTSQPQNRFATFDRAPVHVNQGVATQNGRKAPGSITRDFRDSPIRDSYGVTPAILEEDLRERPMWMMSAYGPGRHPPVQLFGGPQLEQSPEEIRTLHYIALAAGNPQQSAALEAELAEKANQHLQMAMGDIQGALKYLREGEKEHPNRKDICREATTHHHDDGEFSRDRRRRDTRNAPPRGPRSGSGAPAGQSNQSAGFGRDQNPAPNAGFGGRMNGAAMAQIQNGFGQQPSQDGFGQRQGGFGGPSSGFGQQPQSSPFGQQQAPAPSSGFGQPAIQHSGFGQAAAQNENVLFGGQSKAQQAGFGAGIGQQSSGFGQQQSSGFEQQQTSGFGQQQSSGFGAQPLVQQPNGFPAPQTNGTAQAQSSSGFQRSGSDHVNGDHATLPTNPAPSLASASGDISTYTTRDVNGGLTSWKGRSVQYNKENIPCYTGQGGAMERIWFADGPPTAKKVNTMGMIDYPAEVISTYQALRDSASFPNGSIPELPPTLDMTRWDV